MAATLNMYFCLALYCARERILWIVLNMKYKNRFVYGPSSLCKIVNCKLETVTSYSESLSPSLFQERKYCVLVIIPTSWTLASKTKHVPLGKTIQL